MYELTAVKQKQTYTLAFLLFLLSSPRLGPFDNVITHTTTWPTVNYLHLLEPRSPKSFDL